MGYLLIAVETVTGLLEGILIKKYNEKHSDGGFVFTALLSFFSMLFFAGKALVTGAGFNFDVALLPYALLGGALYCGASLLTYLALQYGSFAISMLILSYSLAFPILYGLFFLNEVATVFTYIGLAIIAVSLFLVRQPSSGEEKKFSFKWLVCISISVLGSGLFSVITKVQQVEFENAYDNEFMIISLAFSALFLFVVGIIKDGKKSLNVFKTGLPYAGLAGLSNGATNTLGLLVYLLLPLSISSPTAAATKSIVSFAVSYFIFKERFLKRQVVGVILGAVAIVFLNL